jgi:hypothetical protein
MGADGWRGGGAEAHRPFFCVLGLANGEDGALGLADDAVHRGDW